MHRVTSSLAWIKQVISDSLLCPRSYTAPALTPSPCVTVAGARPGKTCIFPSTVRGQLLSFPLPQVAGRTITGCTRADGDPRAWCRWGGWATSCYRSVVQHWGGH